MADPNSFLNYLQNTFAFWTGSDYCPIGCQIEQRRSLQRVAFAVSVSRAIVQRCVDTQVDLLVTHHGLWWEGVVTPLQGGWYDTIAPLLQQGCGVWSYHLPLDAHPEIGNNAGALRSMGIEPVAPFHMVRGAPIAWQGMVDWSIDHCLQQIQNLYRPLALRHALAGPERVQKIAICSGNGERAFTEAVAQGVQLFISGTGDEMHWRYAQDNGCHFVSVGHHASEKIGLQLLMQQCQHHFPATTCLFFDEENPF